MKHRIRVLQILKNTQLVILRMKSPERIQKMDRIPSVCPSWFVESDGLKFALNL